MRTLVALILAAVSLAACTSTTVEGYADREPPKQKIKSIVVYVGAPQPLALAMKSAINDQARDAGIEADDLMVLLPPTRKYTDADIQKVLRQRGSNAILVINVADSGTVATYAGTNFYNSWNSRSTSEGDINFLGSSGTVSMTGRSVGHSMGTAVPVYEFNRRTAFSAKLLDAESFRTLWVGRGQVASGGGKGWIGRAMVADSVSASNAIKAIFDDLRAKSLIAQVS